jgi:hypothetical protein
MLRQCAWCLCLIDFAGKRISTQPLPKLYEASHGMCDVCGTLWMEQVFNSLALQVPSLYRERYSDQGTGTACVPQDSSSLNGTGRPSIQLQEGDGACIMVCESTSSYSPHGAYSLTEEQEPTVEDHTSFPDLSRISQQRQL